MSELRSSLDIEVGGKVARSKRFVLRLESLVLMSDHLSFKVCVWFIDSSNDSMSSRGGFGLFSPEVWLFSGIFIAVFEKVK